MAGSTTNASRPKASRRTSVWSRLQSSAMSWSIPLGRYFGIPVFVHWTFTILLAFVGFSYFTATEGDLRATGMGIALILAVFGCVLLHEYGHALMARRFGVGTTDITLLPIGGVARLERMPEGPGQELLVAIAGPLVNVGIAIVLMLVGARLPSTGLMGGDFADGFFLLDYLLFVNLFLVGFNLLPAFPMDGGRMLRSLLALKLPYARATRIAASVGQLMAILFAFVGLLVIGNPLLLLIAFFVWTGAEGEARQVEERVSLQDVLVRHAMLTDYQSLRPHDTLATAVSALLAGSQPDFPVITEDGRLVGILSRRGLIEGLSRHGRDARVGDHLVDSGPTMIDINEYVLPALGPLRSGEIPCMVVVDHGHPVGILNLDNISEYLMVRTALMANGHPPSESDPNRLRGRETGTPISV